MTRTDVNCCRKLRQSSIWDSSHARAVGPHMCTVFVNVAGNHVISIACQFSNAIISGLQSQKAYIFPGGHFLRHLLGIPLGVEITSGESEAVITETFSFRLKTTFPGDTLYGKGDKGPEVCITDDCSAGFNST